MTKPTYSDPLWASANAPSSTSSFRDTDLGVVITENTKKAVDYASKRTGFWHGSIHDYFSNVKDSAPEKITGDMIRLLNNRFKSVVILGNIQAAADGQVDMLMTYDVRVAFASGQRTPTTVDMTAIFMTPDRQRIETIDASGSVYADSSSYNFRPALSAAMKEFVYRLDVSTRLQAHAERVISPSYVSRSPGPQVKATDLVPGSYYDKSWAVVIGINDYDIWPSLEYAVNDARAVKEKLKELGFDEVIEILDKDATRARILTLLGSELPKKVGHNDRVVLFFAGHGQTETLTDGKEEGYIIPVDGDITNYFTTAISMEQVRALSRRIPAKHMLYVMDACYSGLGFTRAGGIDPAINGYIRKITSMRSVQMITAGGKGEQAMEREGHGIFTEYLLRGLDGEADRDNDGVVTASELGAFIKPQVSRATQNLQTPQFGRLDGEGDVVFVVPTSATP